MNSGRKDKDKDNYEGKGRGKQNFKNKKTKRKRNAGKPSDEDNIPTANMVTSGINVEGETQDEDAVFHDDITDHYQPSVLIEPTCRIGNMFVEKVATRYLDNCYLCGKSLEGHYPLGYTRCGNG